VRAYATDIDEIFTYRNSRYGRGPIGGTYYAGTSSISANVPQGASTAATPDGRHAGEPPAVGNIMMAFERFVRIQGDAALRHVAGQYAYDTTDDEHETQTLRDNSEEINKLLEQTLDERLDMAGIEIIEARINYLAYAPEIAAVMLRRQQASAIISAREKIVEGAVSMVDMALKKLDKENVVVLDDDKKAAMVSNLMVVLCSESATQPVVNSGTLNM